MKIERKIYAVVLVSILLAAGILSTIATRTITDTGDSFDTFIRNSKGNYWAATGANLQLAINNLGNGGGTVWCGSNITLSSAITMKNYTTIDFQSKIVTLGASNGFVNLTGGNWFNHIKNAVVSVPTLNTKDIIALYIAPAGRYPNRVSSNSFNNIKIENQNPDSHNYTGIHIFMNVDAVTTPSLPSMMFNTFRDIEMRRAGKGIYIQSGNTDGFMNCFSFDNILIDGATYGVEFNVNAGATGRGLSDSTFNNVKIQANTFSKYGFANITGNGNRFTNCIVWDWGSVSSPIYEWDINSDAYYTYIAADWMSPGSYNDGGHNTYINAANIGEFGSGVPSIPRIPYEYMVYKAGAYIVAQRSSTGMIVKNSTSGYEIFRYLLINLTGVSSIFIKSGTYYISTYFSTDEGNVRIVGENEKDTILKCSAATNFAGGMISLPGRSNVSFSHLTFDGNGSNAAGTNRCFLVGSGDSNRDITWDQCVFIGWSKDASSSCIYAVNPTSDTLFNLRVINCVFLNNYDAIDVHGDADPSYNIFWDISDNIFSMNTLAIGLDYFRNSTVTNNRIYGGTYGIVIDDTKNCTITGNIITSTNGIDEQGTSDTNIIMMNNCGMCTTPIDVNGAHTIHINSNVGTVS